MLNLKEISSFWKEVKVKVPADNCDKIVKFKAKFKMLDVDEIQEIQDSDGETNLLDEILLEVKDIKVGEDDNALDMAKKNILTMKALVDTYLSALGLAERKNLKK